MTMDKLFDGSDAHLLPGNAELIQRLNEPELYYPGNFDTPRRANALLSGLCQEAADALEAADKRIAELEAELQKRAKQIGVACMTHDLTHSLACGRCLTEADRKLAVAREALKNLFLSSPIALECNDMHHAKKDQHEYDEDCPVLSRYEDALSCAREALAQIGGDE